MARKRSKRSARSAKSPKGSYGWQAVSRPALALSYPLPAFLQSPRRYGPTRVGLSAEISRLAAGRAEHDRRVAAGLSAPTEKSKRRSSRLNLLPEKQATTKARREPVKDSHHEKVRDPMTCKERPKKNRPTGSGGRKRFIPWCG